MNQSPVAMRADVMMLLAMCPLLATSATTVEAFGAGVSILLATLISSAVLLGVARWLDDTLRLAATLLVAAVVTALIERAMLAWFYPLRDSIGVFLPLIAVNAALTSAWLDADASAINRFRTAASLAIRMALILLLLGLTRELVGHGTIFDDAGVALGVAFARLELLVFRVDMGFLLAMLPPGAFIALGLLFAFYNWLHRARASQQNAQ